MHQIILHVHKKPKFIINVNEITSWQKNHNRLEVVKWTGQASWLMDQKSKQALFSIEPVIVRYG